MTMHININLKTTVTDGFDYVNNNNDNDLLSTHSKVKW